MARPFPSDNKLSEFLKAKPLITSQGRTFIENRHKYSRQCWA